jgi:serine/threonine-protein kinase
MAVVYLAEDLRHERRVAIKVLRPELTSVVAAERFLREIKLTASSLREKLTREKRLPVDDAVRIAREVADALSYAHGRNLLHRDIKPENILLAEGHAVVADFGIARAISEAGGDRLTDTGISIGTPIYMSPEQAAGEREIGKASDLYSLACVLYEMLTGEPPITDASLQKVVSRKMLGDLRPAKEVRLEVPEEVDAAVSKALATEPADRYATASELGQALEPVRPERSMGPKRRRVLWTAAAAVVVVAGLTWYIGWGGSPDPMAEPPSVAVLPLVNRSGLEEDAYFTDGIHDEILTQLSKISGLSVRARTSVMEYRDSPKNVRQIGEELNARYLLEGGVQRSGRTVRINVQLIDSQSDEHVFAETYDRELTIEDLLAVQRDVAVQIADVLATTLTPGEQELIASTPTDDLEAYDYYLRGEGYRNRGPVEEDLRLAVEMYEEAIRRDTTFALAYVGLSRAARELYWWFERGRDDRLRTEGCQAAFTALRINASLPEARRAVAGCYDDRGDDTRAREHLLAALAKMPNNSDLFAMLAERDRRQGKWEEALAWGKRAAELDPRNAESFRRVATTLGWMRRYAEAEEYFDRAIALAPSVEYQYVFKARLYISWEGDIEKAWNVLSTAPTTIALGSVLLRNVSSAWWLYRVLLDRNGPDIDDLSLATFGGDTAAYFLGRAEAFRLANNRERMRAYYDSARVALDSRITAAPNDPRLHSELGMALAALGHQEEALSHGTLAVNLLPITEDAIEGYDWPAYLAQMHLELGNYDAAIDQLEILLSNPGWVTVAWLGVDPFWDPLRDHPRFQALLTKYE